MLFHPAAHTLAAGELVDGVASSFWCSTASIFKRKVARRVASSSQMPCVSISVPLRQNFTKIIPNFTPRHSVCRIFNHPPRQWQGVLHPARPGSRL